MMIYNCADVDFLLQNLDEKDLVFSHHSNKRSGQRLINKEFSLQQKERSETYKQGIC